MRVGGKFVYPPVHRSGKGEVKNLVLVAGGVGVNPFMSVLGAVAHAGAWPERTTLLYGTQVPSEEEGGLEGVLFYERAKALKEVDTKVFTGSRGGRGGGGAGEGVLQRRMTVEDVRGVVCGDDGKAREGTVCYVCGPKGMTDEFVEGVKGFEGMKEQDVMCERWW